MNFSKLPSWTWTAGGLGLALAAGVMIGRVSAPGADAGAARESQAGGKSGGRDSRGGLTGDERSARTRESARAKSGTTEQDLAKILSSPNRLERTEKLLAYLDRLPTDQFAAVYDQLRNSPSAKLQGSERSLVLQAWADRDPLMALGFLQEKGAEDWERETAVSTWASKDPQAAFAWASAASDEGDVNNWLLGAARGIAMTNPELARDYLSQMEGETRNRALRDMQPYVAQYGFDYASAWVTSISDEGLRGQASRTMAGRLVCWPIYCLASRSWMCPGFRTRAFSIKMSASAFFSSSSLFKRTRARWKSASKTRVVSGSMAAVTSGSDIKAPG